MWKVSLIVLTLSFFLLPLAIADSEEEVLFNEVFDNGCGLAIIRLDDSHRAEYDDDFLLYAEQYPIIKQWEVRHPGFVVAGMHPGSNSSFYPKASYDRKGRPIFKPGLVQRPIWAVINYAKADALNTLGSREITVINQTSWPVEIKVHPAWIWPVTIQPGEETKVNELWHTFQGRQTVFLHSERGDGSAPAGLKREIECLPERWVITNDTLREQDSFFCACFSCSWRW